MNNLSDSFPDSIVLPFRTFIQSVMCRHAELKNIAVVKDVAFNDPDKQCYTIDIETEKSIVLIRPIDKYYNALRDASRLKLAFKDKTVIVVLWLHAHSITDGERRKLDKTWPEIQTMFDKKGIDCRNLTVSSTTFRDSRPVLDSITGNISIYE